MDRKVNTEKFLALPKETQLLYFHLKERAKDGVVPAPLKIVRLAGCSERDLELLIEGEYVKYEGKKLTVPSLMGDSEKVQRAEELFETLWKKYPNKKGKTQVSKTTKEKLLKYDPAELERAVERYASEVKGREPRYILNGSTFFNGRIYDYLDTNYGELPKRVDISDPNSYSDEDAKWL